MENSVFSPEGGNSRGTLIAKFIILAVADVEANFLIVKAYQYTTITSVTLLDCFTVPCVVVLSAAILGVRYRVLHWLGILACLVGLVLIVFSDLSKAEPGPDPLPAPRDRLLGDGLVLCGAGLYAVSNTMQVVGDGPGAAGAFTTCLFLLYSLVPKVLVLSGSTFLNLSILTSDFWAVLFGVTVLQERPSLLYFAAFAATLAGLVLYHAHGEPARGPLRHPPDSDPEALPGDDGG
eukprot:CAMPEP_0172191046 /NCGR_PEP_ID=MMETSP1050-20130122/23464_1 /TAXON_ID=233186 /ORGANISM="Cryptomonas curvata, Strain CCAP979/52" /LENGTH=234 /DNA_ID=CAMNT_0012866013 /DNA_START=276 /DNA_END=978 /DNA_ORIENTATION=+